MMEVRMIRVELVVGAMDVLGDAFGAWLSRVADDVGDEALVARGL